MRSVVHAMTILLCVLSAKTPAQVPNLPVGSQTRWEVDEPRQIVAYVVFDPAVVKSELPQSLRFVNLRELATAGIPWATDYLAERPAEGNWGISFLEIVRMGTFIIDGRYPNWPKDGAAALWFARVAPSDPTTNLGPGRPYLALEFWMPDRAYVAYMREKGFSATYGEAKLFQDSDGTWRGTINADGLRVAAACMPAGRVSGGTGSAGTQTLFPPFSSSVQNVVRVAFAGHRERECGNGSSLDLHGKHPLTGGNAIKPLVFEYGYTLKGGTYRK